MTMIKLKFDEIQIQSVNPILEPHPIQIDISKQVKKIFVNLVVNFNQSQNFVTRA